MRRAGGPGSGRSPAVPAPPGRGPVTLFGIGPERDGAFRFVSSQGELVPGPLPAIGSTTSRPGLESVQVR